MSEYWTDFVQESRERITQLNNALLCLERTPDDEEAMENIFRIAHTLKGNCGAAGFESASDLAHAIEDLLDAVRGGRISVTPELMDGIFDAVDELEAMIDEVDGEGEIRTDPSSTIRTLRNYLERSAITSIEAPTADERSSILSRFDPPANDNHDAYLARIAIAEGDSEAPTNGTLVVDALVDAFDLIGTVPSRERIEDGAYGGQFDAVFGCAVGEAAIVSGLEPVEEVSDFELVEVTEELAAASRAGSSEREPIETGTLTPDVDGADISSDEAMELGVDELLDEFDEFDDLDEKVKEVEADDDLGVFDEMGEAGSFDDLFEQAEGSLDEQESRSEDPIESGSESSDEPDASTPSDAGSSDDDEQVEDAEEVFAELKAEVDTVGFDELQDELAELEFDEFGDEEEVSMDELLGDEFEDETDGVDAHERDDDLEDVLVDPDDGADEVSDAKPAVEAEDVLGSPDVDTADTVVEAEDTVESTGLEDDHGHEPADVDDGSPKSDDAPEAAEATADDPDPELETEETDDLTEPDTAEIDEADTSEDPDELLDETEDGSTEDEAVEEETGDGAFEEETGDGAFEEETADGAFEDVEPPDTLEANSAEPDVSFDESEESTVSPVDGFEDDGFGQTDSGGFDEFDDSGAGGFEDVAGERSGFDDASNGFDESEDVGFGGADSAEFDDEFGSDDIGFDDSDGVEASVESDRSGEDAADSSDRSDSALEDANDSVDPLDLVDDADDSFEETFGDDAFEDVDDTEFGVGIDGFGSSDSETASSDRATDEPSAADEDVPRIVDEPSLDIPDITVPEPSDRPETSQKDDGIQSVRVDTDQVDELMTLVEGLVTSRVRLRHEVESDRDLGAIEAELDDLEGLTTELQETVMNVRLVPLETVVNRLPRIVRDIAREQDKDVSFEIRGEDVELDRSVLDRIRDPLVHLVRNAVDHGIEKPDERDAAGKPREGQIEVTASRTRDQVTITVSDDGSGLDPDRLRSEAVDAGVLSAAEADELSDEETAHLIFHSGLSTATEVTDVSGRGVGMDVVKRTIEEMDGTVSIDSQPGDGTTVTMTLPVSIAIDDVLFVQSGDEEFGVPTEAVQDVETAAAIETVDDERVFSTGDETYPVIDLDETLETPGRSANGDGVVVRIRDSVRPVVLHCDEVHGQQEVVVKPFEGFMGGVPGLSGATVRGRGKVVNIIDVTTL
ncbi:chemotaxis protein CheA [Natrarchaeobius chitinivorans]|uniref:Chemotaxis protein CheA n=1 Tax=Natrarchaeobius chitinivorans TaxID=1679083 RepID=A0A3N6LXJ7_NATCH|nr:chemotaxis protein CheA [Natrarchaeobius chitinivorans]RQG92514.1 chemotaxis protein CheA [Natrarchaeobius chitinivorans]